MPKLTHKLRPHALSLWGWGSIGWACNPTLQRFWNSSNTGAGYLTESTFESPQATAVGGGGLRAEGAGTGTTAAHLHLARRKGI